MRRLGLAATAVLLLAGCSSPGAITGGGPAASPYTGPMSLSLNDQPDASVLARSGAAGQALQCETDPYAGGAGHYDDGLESTQSSPAKALGDYFTAEGVGAALPTRGYQIERNDGGRVLLSYDVNGRTKIAFVAANDVRDYRGDSGWGITSWAACDPAELPAEVTDKLGIGIWVDRAGHRVPAARIQSYQGAARCDSQDITFIQLGRGVDEPQYVRDASGALASYLRTTFQAATSLPTNASDTGLHRDGRELWLSADKNAAYLVSLNDRHDVERWPAAKRFIGCA
jgi:hypothetical protein